ncbi:MAG TPA: hypothetical protein VGD50_01710, partial [Candidatus Baltobacteraceae bacterium]
FGERADACERLPEGTSLLAIPATPSALDFSELYGMYGRLAFFPVGKELGESFPRLTAQLGLCRVRALAHLSTLVGMVCPGLHSIFSDLDIQFARGDDDPPNLGFSVTGGDERFRMLHISVSGGGLCGRVNAFVRRPPVLQPALADLSRHIDSKEFASTTALIVGGSRGLGALTARAIVAGGGRAIVTYLNGEADAQALVEECGQHATQALRYNAGSDAAPQLQALRWTPNHLYYFATPQIFRQKSTWFVSERFREFCRIYVDGFADLCAVLRAKTEGELRVFYPSSVAVVEHPRDMTEYRMAKAAGELLCADMNRFARGTRVLVARLPRVLTDQTATVMPVESSEPIEIMLPLIRTMHAPPTF